jgi:hypothetical protein
LWNSLHQNECFFLGLKQLAPKRVPFFGTEIACTKTRCLDEISS